MMRKVSEEESTKDKYNTACEYSEICSCIPLPERKVFSVDLYPSVYLPLFMTKAKRELILSMAFFYRHIITTKANKKNQQRK